MMEKESRLRHMVLTGLFAALICITTAFILHIPVGNGYIHLGDSFIYLAACVLPMPYGIIAAALGGSMADLLSGYAIYALPTAIIKSMLACCFYGMGVQKPQTLLSRRSVIASVLCVPITVIGYYLTAVILYGNPVAQIAETVPANLVQAGCSAALFCIAAFALDRVKLPMLRR